MSDVRPFLAGVASPTRGLAQSLPAVATPAANSPWSPQRPAAPAAPAIDHEKLHAEARERGRAEGLRETEGLRQRLASLVAALEAAGTSAVAPTADAIAEAACCVIESWLGQTERAQLIAPAVRGWIERHPEPGAVASAHPDDVAALTQAIGDAPLAVVADPALARGELRIRGGALELRHSMSARLGELRTAIAAALGARP
ncbi:MAG TPA: hypothetical protein VLX92_05265 [Kofleriaceae bacterium]|nr:hypothetical protein [Kofleriaceae bacterium]